MIPSPRLTPALRLIRFPLTFPVWSSILAAHLIATRGNPQWETLIVQLTIGAAVFWGAMVLHACLDRRAGRRDWPVPGRLDSPLAGWLVGAILMVLGLGLAALAGGANLRFALTLAVALLAYYGFLRDNSLGPLLAGAGHYALWMLGFAVIPLATGVQFLVMPVFLYAAGVSFLALGARTGKTRAGLRLGGILLAVATLLLIGAIASGRLDIMTLAPLTLGIALVAYWRWELTKEPTPEALRGLADRLLLGLIPLDALLLFGTGHETAAAALPLLAIPMWLLSRGGAAD